MPVTLPPELEQYVADQVASGMYPTETDVIRTALELMRDQDVTEPPRDELRRLLAVGIADSEAGRTVPLTRELIESIKSEGRERLAENRRHA